MSEPFRTRTGQTGRDAYLNEATAIANAQRELDVRFRALLRTVYAEAPELIAHPTDYHPELTYSAESAKGFCEYIRVGCGCGYPRCGRPATQTRR